MLVSKLIIHLSAVRKSIPINTCCARPRCTMSFAPIRSGLRKKRVRAAPLPGPEDDEPPAAVRPSRPRLGEHQRSASQSWRQTPQRRTLTLQEEEDVEDEDDEEPAPLFCRRTSTPTSSFSSRGSQWRRSTLSSLDSAIDVDNQQSDHEAQDVPRPGRKRPKRGPTATVTTVEPVASTAAEEKDTGKMRQEKAQETPPPAATARRGRRSR